LPDSLEIFDVAHGAAARALRLRGLSLEIVSSVRLQTLQMDAVRDSAPGISVVRLRLSLSVPYLTIVLALTLVDQAITAVVSLTDSTTGPWVNLTFGVFCVCLAWSS